MALRDHDPIILEEFNGLWARGDGESVPSDHFYQADNIQYIHSGFETRCGINKYEIDNHIDLGDIIRIYNYTMQTGQSLLYLTTGGNIYHKIGNAAPVHILRVAAMQDFGFVAYAGRAYITPFATYIGAPGIHYELGIKNEFVYVYKGDGTPARPAGGKPPSNPGVPLVAALGAPSDGPTTDAGFHLIAVIYETDTGYYTAPGPEVFASLEFSGAHKIDVSNIPVSVDAYVKKRHLVSTKLIETYNGDQNGYQFFFIPEGNIDNNVDTTKTVEYFDADLLEDASYLIDNFAQIPAGVNLTIYHSRLVIVGEFGTDETLTGLPDGITDNRSIARLSEAGEPEAIHKVDGLIIVPLDGAPLTNAQEFRDILYLYKKTRTYAYSDDLDVPSGWQEQAIDQAIGCPVHGVMTVLDAGGVNVDFLIIADQSGLLLFNGTYARPELSWKIADLWNKIDKDAFRFVSVMGDPLFRRIWITLPDPSSIATDLSIARNVLLYADYGNGLDPQNIRWARWVLNINATSMCFLEPDKIILASTGNDSGLYILDPTISRDTQYILNVKIPDPTVRLAFLGE